MNLIPNDFRAEEPFEKKRSKKSAQVFTLIVLIVVSLVFVLYPFIPLAEYKIFGANNFSVGELQPASGDNILVIPKIGVTMLISDSLDEDGALNEGAYHFFKTSTPDKGGNTVLSAHRFKYLPPSSETFYLLDKLIEGDTFMVFWEGTQYNYRVASTTVVDPYAIEVLNQTKNSTVTLITCNPVFSTKERLVVSGELI